MQLARSGYASIAKIVPRPPSERQDRSGVVHLARSFSSKSLIPSLYHRYSPVIETVKKQTHDAFQP